ncbi:MAG: CvpA family protein [Thiomonas sp.]|uniref:CvpA family protein n=1 Tax=Thiomonas sp. TaxID=2047785 RepID=UPI002A3723C2|nr:CvpA family protein [Thiomonas sp.]MDY0330722.1 CvpA family protein [Thiomonas sp.]
MSPLDWFLLVVMGLSVLISLLRGAVYEIVTLLGWIAGVWFAAHFAPSLGARYLQAIDNTDMRLLAAYAMCFIVVVLSAGILASMLRLLLRASGLGIFDRSMGALIGLVKGVALSLLLVALAAQTALSHSAMWKTAVLIPPAQSLLLAIRPWLPAAFVVHLPQGEVHGFSPVS